MTLPFSKKWPKSMGELAGQPNYFVEKILLGMFRYYPISFVEIRNIYSQMGDRELTSFLEIVQLENEGFPKKIHTIRSGNRWRAGMNIHMVINNRTKDRFQFAPVVNCISVQQIEITYTQSCIGVPLIRVLVESRKSPGYMSFFDMYFPDSNHSMLGNIKKLAINDGFDSVEDFFKYFNSDFKGQIIHWTDLEY